MKIKTSKIFKYVIFLYFFILIISFPKSQASMIERSLTYVENLKENFIVFHFEIVSPMNYEFISNDEYVVSVAVTNYAFSIHHISENITLNSVNFTLTSPSNRHFYYELKQIQWQSTNSQITKIFYIQNFPFEFNESGAWYLQIFFKVNKNTTIWEYADSFLNLNENSQVRTVFPFGEKNYFQKGITIYTINELTSLRAAIAAEKTANQYGNSIWILLGSAIASAFTAGFAAYNVNEMLKGKKVESIKHMIQGSMIPAIKEFNEFKEIFEKLQQGRLVKLPNYLNSSIIKTSHWKDFQIEYKARFVKRNIKTYLEKKEKIQKIRNEINNEVIKQIKIKRIEIPNSYQFLIQMKRKYKIAKTPKKFFEEDSIDNLAQSIIQIETTGSDYAKEIFNKYKEDWLSIREENVIKEKIRAFLEIVNTMKKFQKTGKSLSFDKGSIMNKYCILNWELEEHVIKLKQEGFVTPIFNQEFTYNDTF